MATLLTMDVCWLAKMASTFRHLSIHRQARYCHKISDLAWASPICNVHSRQRFAYSHYPDATDCSRQITNFRYDVAFDESVHWRIAIFGNSVNIQIMQQKYYILISILNSWHMHEKCDIAKKSYSFAYLKSRVNVRVVKFYAKKKMFKILFL